MNRKTFLAILMGLPMVRGLLAKPKQGPLFPESPETPEHSRAYAHGLLKLLARETMEITRTLLKMQFPSNLISAFQGAGDPLGGILRASFGPLITQPGDTVNIPYFDRIGGLRNIEVEMKYAEASFQVPGAPSRLDGSSVTDRLANPEYRAVLITPAAIAIAERIRMDAPAKGILVTRRLRMPPQGTGAIAEYAESEDFGMRLVIGYSPRTLAQTFNAEVLYGVGDLSPAS